MSIWLDADITLNPNHLNPNLSPQSGILKILKDRGLDVEKPYSEMSLTRTSKYVFRLSICNPDGYVDEIHNSFKQLVKQPYVQDICILQHHYS